MQKFPVSSTHHAQKIGLSLRMTKIMRRVAWLKRMGYSPENLRRRVGVSNCPRWLAQANVEDLEMALGIRYRPDTRDYTWRREGAEMPPSLENNLASSIVARKLKTIVGHERTSTKESRAQSGLPVTKSALPYGYQWGEKKQVRIDGALHEEAIPEPDPREAEIVQLMFDLYMEGESPAGIARYLNEKGHRTRKGGKWKNESVRDILNNPFYAGFIRYRGMITDEHGRRKQPRYTGKLYPGLHEPLISLDEWDEMQEERYWRALASSRHKLVKPQYEIVGKPPGKRYFVEGGEIIVMREDI